MRFYIVKGGVMVFFRGYYDEVFVVVNSWKKLVLLEFFEGEWKVIWFEDFSLELFCGIVEVLVIGIIIFEWG